ncbi:hypothetical protein BJ122_11637 [Rhodopseudomonas faecalis]|uniref:Uncharacterized protein n=1 Tax=Rhodopseudomonas faecalis TaxID=99655 RepID=A0A318TJ71_9BRAD|nr:hypothetical protein [Rhodopseudomonas faecalis]PYF01905.1 hypothetical protein BJ122_11637 [Rhodopseudomonas faecalis]
MINVRQLHDGDPGIYQVAVRDTAGSSQYRVTMARALRSRLVGDQHPPERCVEAAFRFLLAREPKEAILREFDVAVISRYFPEFEAQWPRYLADPTL